MPDESRTGQPPESELSATELLALFKHLDNIHAGKEKVLLPTSLAPLPIVLLNWQDLSPPVIGVAGIMSVCFYLYHCVVLLRFKALQEKIFERVSEFDPTFQKIVEYPPFLDVPHLRLFFALGYAILWFVLFHLKGLGM